MIYVNLIKERKNREYTNDIAHKVASSESETHQTWSTNQMKKKMLPTLQETMSTHVVE